MIEDMLPPEEPEEQASDPFQAPAWSVAGNTNYTQPTVKWSTIYPTAGDHTHSFNVPIVYDHTVPTGTAYAVGGGISALLNSKLNAAMEQMKDSITTQLYSSSPLMNLLQEYPSVVESTDPLDSLDSLEHAQELPED